MRAPLTVKTGEPIYLDVNVAGEPAPEITWALAGKSILITSHRRIENVPYNTKYINDNPERKDNGLYTIHATNQYGSDTAEIQINVIGKPAKPEGPLEVSDIHKDGCKLAWKKPKDDGGEPIDAYLVEKFDPDTGVWLPVGRTDGATPELKVDGLTPGHEYKFRVKAITKEGESEPLETLGTIIARDPFTVPTAPGTPEPADWSASHIDLVFNEPASDGGSPITGYIVEKKDKYGPIWEKAAETNSPLPKATVNGLIEGNEYQFRIIAVNRAGPSEPSDASKTFIAKPRYLAPKIDRRHLRDVTISAGTSLKYDVNISGEPAPDVEWRFNNRVMQNTKAVGIESVPYNTKLVIRPAQRGDSGEYSVIAKNSSGTDTVVVSVIVTDKPGAPEGPLEVSDVNKDGCKLKWKRPKDDGGAPIEYFQVEKLDTATGLWSPCTRSTEPQAEVHGLTPGQEYKFRVLAVNAEGESVPLETEKSYVAKNAFDEPSKPKDVRPINWDRDFVELAWTAPDSDGGAEITSYIVEKKDKYGAWEKAVEVSPLAVLGLTAKVPDLVEGQTYEFRVRAVNKAGPSEPSDTTGPIVAKPRNQSPRIDRTNLVEVRIKAGHQFVFDAKVTGEPAPTTRWELNGREVKNSERVKVQHVDYNTKLVVRNATRAESGEYVVTAENKSGLDTVKIRVTVLDKPGAPNGPLAVSDVHATGAKLSWQPPSDDGGQPVEKYVVEKMDEKTGRWLPAGETTGPVTQLAVDGLQPGHKYKFRVRAVNKQGKSEPLINNTSILAKNPFDAPGAPGLPEIKDYDADFVELAWQRPDTDGGSPITGYVIEKRDRYSPDWEPCANVEGDTCRGRVPDLIEGQTYEFRVRAVNKAGPGEASAATGKWVARPKNLAPRIDRNALLNVKIRAGLNFDWDVPVVGEPVPSKEWSMKGNVLINTDRVKITSEAGRTRLRCIDAKRSDSGEYLLVAKNVNGTDSATVTVLVLDVPGPPEGPLRPEEVTRNNCTLRWRQPRDDGGSEITHYVVEKMDAEAMRWVTVGECAGTSIRAEGLIEGHDYNFRVRAVNKQGESLPLNTTQAVTAKDPYGPPGQPDKPEVTDWDKDHVDLKWAAPKKDGGAPISAYVIEKRARFGPWEKACEVPGTALAATVPDLHENEEYEFRIVAVNKGGPGEPSDASAPVVCKPRFIKPYFDARLLEDLLVHAGKRIRWVIPVQAAPRPTWQWQQNGVVVPVDSNRSDQQLYQGDLSFEIPFAVRATDQGTYTLTLKNELGECKANAQVTVLDRPSKPQPPLGVTGITKEGCHLEWRTPQDDGGSPILHYVVEKMDLSRGTWSDAGMSTTLQHDVRRLVFNKEYLFRVKAVNAIGESDALEADHSIVAKNEFDEPGAPGKPAVVDWDRDHVDLEWEAPKSDGGSPITGYILQKKEKGSPYWTNAVQVPAGQTKGTVPGLTEGQDYEFRVIAVNKAGQSEPSENSDVVTAKPRNLAPKIITPLVDIHIKAGHIVHTDISFIGEPAPEVTWTCGSRQLQTNERTTITSIGHHTIVHTVNCGRPDSGTYKLHLRNASGEASGEFQVVILDRPGPPQEPFEFEEITGSSVTVSWKPPKDNGGSEITAYVIEKRDLTHGGGWVPAVSYVNPKNTHATVPRLIEGTKYEFRVSAENLQGRSEPLQSDRAIVAKNQYDVPGRPHRPELVDSDKDHITIKWKKPISNGGSHIIGYEVERADKATGRWMRCTKDPVPNREFRDDRVQEGHQYEYRVTAVNAAGAGKPSDPSAVFAARPMNEPPKLHLDSLPNRRVKVRAGEPICVDIPIGGAPIPTIEWHKAGAKLFESSRISMRTSDVRTVLRIDVSTRADANKYTVSAENKHGKDSGDVEVLVVDRPGAPGGPLVYSATTQETVALAWSPPKDDGGGEITGYTVEVTEADGPEHWRPVPGYCARTALTAKNLVEGRKYIFRVCAENIYGIGEPLVGKPVTAKCPFDPPQAPGQPKVVSHTPNSASLEWKAPDNCGGKPITGYLVEKRERGGQADWQRANNYTTPNVAFTVQDLRENARYEFRVIAVNEAGPGPASKPSEAITATDMKHKPSAPDAPKADRVTKNSVTLSWRPPRAGDGRGKAKSYVVQRRQQGGNWTDCHSDPIVGLVFTVPNLNEGEEYSFRVIAVNEAGQSEPSKPSAAIRLVEQPNKPCMDLGGLRDITVRAGEDFSIHVPYVGHPQPTAAWYANDLLLGEAADERLFQQLAVDSAAFVCKNSRRTDSGQYRVQLRNASGFDTATCTVRVLDRPGRPEQLRAEEFAGDALTLYWNAPRDDGGVAVTNYIIERREAQGATWAKVNSYCTVPFIRIRNLTIGREYEFRVYAENKYGVSEPAATEQPIRARHPFDVPAAPGTPKGTESTDDSISIQWQRPRHDGGSPITGYAIEKRLISEEKWTRATHALVPDTWARLGGLIENHDYEFRVAALNLAGQGPWSSSSDQLCCRAAPQAPRITSDLSIRDMTVIAGHEFRITVPYTGTPRPRASWTVNGVDVGSGDERIHLETSASESLFVNKCAKRSETGVYTIHLANCEGTDSATCRVTVVDRPTVPVGPLDVTDVTPDACTLSWKPPLDDGGSPISNYVVERIDASGMWVKVSSFVRGTHYEVMGLEANKKYYFRVRAENQYGQSEPLAREDAVCAQYPFTVPDAPGAPKVIDWDATNVKLIWDRPRSDGGSRIRGYRVEWRDVTTGDGGMWMPHEVLIKDNAYQLYNLSGGHDYEFRVLAENAAGRGRPSQPSSAFRLKGKFTVPAKPGTPTVSKVGRNYAELRWSKPASDGGARITGYVIERRDAGGAIWTKCNDYTVLDTEFTVMHLTENADYEFRVAAVNAAGRGESSACTMPIKICEVLGGTKPEWVRPLRDTTAPAAKYAVLECEASGQPAPTSRWLRNGREIALAGRFTSETKAGVFRLHCAEIQAGDEGDYTCEAINSLGFVHTTCRLRVGTPPSIVRCPTELFLAEGDNAKIKIHYAGDQPMDFVLRKNGQPVPDVKYTIFDEYIAISMRSIAKSDAGAYVAELSNHSGKAAAQFAVYITGLPGPPQGPLEVTAVTQHSCHLAWKPPAFDGGMRVTHYVVERKDVALSHWIVVSSFAKELHFTVQGLSERQEYMFRILAVNANGAGPPLEGENPVLAKLPIDPPGPPGTPKVTSVGDDFVHLEWSKPTTDGGSRIQGYWIDKRETGCHAWQRVNVAICLPTQQNCANLIEGRHYEFRVVAQNEAGLSLESNASKVVKIVDPKAATPPHVERPLRDAHCIQNHNAQFTCVITGQPKPVVTWYKGAREIGNGARYHVYADGDTYNLTINDVFGEDADEYVCRAVNKAGVKSTRAELVIMSEYCQKMTLYI